MKSVSDSERFPMTDSEKVVDIDRQIDTALILRGHLEKEAERVHRGILEVNSKLRELGKKKSELLTLELKLEP